MKFLVVALVVLLLVTACCPEGSTWHATYTDKRGTVSYSTGEGCGCKGPGLWRAAVEGDRLTHCYVTKP